MTQPKNCVQNFKNHAPTTLNSLTKGFAMDNYGQGQANAVKTERAMSRIDNDVEMLKRFDDRVKGITDHIIRHARALGRRDLPHTLRGGYPGGTCVDMQRNTCKDGLGRRIRCRSGPVREARWHRMIRRK